MTTTTPRLDRVIRIVMWLDAFLSVAMVVVCVLGIPVVMTVGVPHGMRMTFGILAIVCAVLLGVFGPIYAVALMLRMRAGLTALPPRLRLPLPGPLRPASIPGGFQSSRRMQTDVSLVR